MSIGQRRTLSKRTVSGVDANVILTLLMLKASKEVACPNGSKLPVVGRHHRFERHFYPFLPSFCHDKAHERATFLLLSNVSTHQQGLVIYYRR